eukprot:4101450-Pleurochrysis_carterae.AAC.1
MRSSSLGEAALAPRDARRCARAARARAKACRSVVMGCQLHGFAGHSRRPERYSQGAAGPLGARAFAKLLGVRAPLSAALCRSLPLSFSAPPSRQPLPAFSRLPSLAFSLPRVHVRLGCISPRRMRW